MQRRNVRSTDQRQLSLPLEPAGARLKTDAAIRSMPRRPDRVDADRSTASRRAEKGHRSEQWGLAAENDAERRYLARGGRILARRHRTEAGELDLVVSFGDLLVFVEVKARKTVEQALNAVRPRQWARLADAAALFAAERFGDRVPDMRFDLVGLGRNGDAAIVENTSMDFAA